MKKQWLLLCLCNGILYTAFSALIGLMPVYLPRLDASATVTGFFLAFIYLALAIGTIVGGTLSDRFERRQFILVLCGLTSIPITWLMSQTASIWFLLFLMMSLWFLTGVAMTMINILMGLFSETENKGRNFGLLYLSAGAGMFLGGFVNGRIVDSAGFTGLFALFAGFYLLIPLIGYFIEDKKVQSEWRSLFSFQAGLFDNHTFTLLFVAFILAQMANIVMFLTRPVMMERLNFNATAIGNAAAIGSLVTLPLPIVVGWLADRVSRKLILLACLLAPVLGLLTLAVATNLWHFWISSAFSTILGTGTVVGSALMMDMYGEERMGAPLAWLNATPWIGIVIGLSWGGVSMNAFQIVPTILLALLPSLLAIFLLTRLRIDQAELQTDARRANTL